MRQSRKLPKPSQGVMYRNLACKDDVMFLLKSWIRDYTHPKNEQAGSISKQHLVRAVKATITELLEAPEVHVVMAVNEKKPSQLYAFVCYELTEKFPVVHYIYVKAPFRPMQLEPKLLAIASGDFDISELRYTFRTRALSKYLSGHKFIPNFVRRGRQKEKHAQNCTPQTQLGAV